MTTETTNPNRLTREFIQGLSDGAKDMLCDIYEVVDRHKDNPNFEGTPPNFDSIEGVYRGVRCTKYYNVIDAKSLDRFIANLDHIKELVDNRPEVKVVYYSKMSELYQKVETDYCKIHEYRTFRGYETQDLRYNVKLIGRKCKFHIVSTKNITW